MQSNSQDTLIFVHLPKTGGYSLEGLLARQYPTEGICRITVIYPETVTSFFSLTSVERERIRCLTGHMPFGMHAYLPGKSRYITMLRDPVERFISQYRHHRRDPAIAKQWDITEADLASIENYLQWWVACGQMNLQTWLISGCWEPKQKRPPSRLPDDALERAKENLAKRFDVVGLTERFDESISLMKRKLGWHASLLHIRKNTARKPTGREMFGTAIMERIAEHSKIDIELVAFANELLDEAIRSQNGTFRKELRQLRYLNHAINGTWHSYKLCVPKRLQPTVEKRLLPGLRKLGYAISKHLISSRRVTF